jgi:hypothetical protein
MMSDVTKGTDTIHHRGDSPIDERVRMANETGSFAMIAARQYQLAERWFYEVTIEYRGKRFIGTSEIRFGGTGNEATTPLENAETAAVGRALRFANGGAADEVTHPHPTMRQSTPEVGAGTLPPTDAQRKKAHAEARRIGEAKARAYLEKTFGVTTTSELSRRQMSQLIDWLTHQPSLPTEGNATASETEHS